MSMNLCAGAARELERRAPRARQMLEARCTAIADRVVPAYRSGKGRSCTGHYARQWQSAWDGACIALGGKPEDFRR